MGMLLDDPDGILGMDMRTYYKNRLENDRILINQIDRAIAEFNKAGGVQEYTIDTGQDRQTVKRADLASLYTWRRSLIEDVDAIMRALNPQAGWVQVVPGY